MIPRIPGYELHRRLGAGGMGVVYLATRSDNNFQYAIKMLLSGQNASIEDLVRFRIEAEAYACLNHQNIIKIRDVGVVAGCPFLSMDFAENGTLSSYLKNKPNLDLGWRVRTIRCIADALAHAHGRRILHRDLKPANILIASDGTPKVSDFGLVKFSAPIRNVSESCCTMSVTALDMYLLDHVESQHRGDSIPINASELETLVKQSNARYSQQVDSDGMSVDEKTIIRFVTSSMETRRNSQQLAGLLDEQTQAGFIMGSPQYMSPEQAEGNVQAIGPHTDIYGLGTTLYSVLTGRPPIGGQSTFEIVRNVLTVIPTLPSDLNRSIPTGLSRVVMKALEKKPEDRYANMEMFGEDLDRVMAGKPTMAELHSHVRSRKSLVGSIVHRVSKSISGFFANANSLESTVLQKHVDRSTASGLSQADDSQG